jgi:hypothetical protein
MTTIARAATSVATSPKKAAVATPPAIAPPSLRPVSRAEAKAFAAQAANFQYQGVGKKLHPVPWAFIPGRGCNYRAFHVAFAAAMGKQADFLPKTVSNDVIRKLQYNPEIETMRVNLAAPMKLKCVFTLPNGKRVARPYPVEWNCHRAVALNVEGKIHVIDLSVSAEPLPLNRWIARFLGPDHGAKLLSEDDESRLEVYLDQGVPIPRHLQNVDAGYSFSEFFPKVDPSPMPIRGGTIRYDLGLKEQFDGNSTDMREFFAEHGQTLAEEDVAKVRLTMKSLPT